MKLFVFSFLFISTHLFVNGQAHINWLSIEEVAELNKENPKKIVIDIYTKWCGWCKKMDKTTFKDQELINYLNENYYAVKFDAEQKTDIVYQGKTYKYIKNSRRGYHELAAKLLQGKLSFPSFVFLDEKMEVIQPIATYINAVKFKMIATYFAENSHVNTPWSTFSKRYRKQHGIKK